MDNHGAAGRVIADGPDGTVPGDYTLDVSHDGTPPAM
jgi:hypothetical protein